MKSQVGAYRAMSSRVGREWRPDPPLICKCAGRGRMRRSLLRPDVLAKQLCRLLLLWDPLPTWCHYQQGQMHSRTPALRDLMGYMERQDM